jgi:hypothetical protein
MAYEFSAASSQYLSSAASVVDGSSFPFTMACWFYQSTLATGVMLSVSSQFQNWAGIAILNTGAVRTIHAGGGQADTTTATTAGTWSHACGVFSANNSRTSYLNAGGAATNTAFGANIGANSTLIGARRFSGAIGTYHAGLLAECGIWNAALTVAEIASLAKGMTCDKVRPQSLVFYAPLIRDLQDVRGGLTITNNNGATVADHPRVYA